MDFRSMTIDDIMAWCQEHHEVAWLKAEAAKKTKVKVYPRIKVEKTVKDKDGKEVVKMVSIADKDKPYTLEERPITFVQIKTDFATKFMPELIQDKKNKKPSMYDRIAALED